MHVVAFAFDDRYTFNMLRHCLTTLLKDAKDGMLEMDSVACLLLSPQLASEDGWLHLHELIMIHQQDAVFQVPHTPLWDACGNR